MSNAYSIDLRTGLKNKVHDAEITGYFSNQQVQLATKCRNEIDQAIAHISGVKNNIFVRLDVGNTIGNLNNVTALGSDDLTNIEIKTGQVTMISLWASTCAFGLKHMDELQKIIEENKNKWSGKVRFLALSTDHDKSMQQAAITERGYTGFEHYNIRNAQCKLHLYFNAKQTPFCALLDWEGKVAFKGHPSSRRLDEDIQTLCKARKISGRGCASLKATKDSEWRDAGAVVE